MKKVIFFIGLIVFVLFTKISAYTLKNYPNPFSPSKGEKTKIEMKIDLSTEFVSYPEISIYTISGELVFKWSHYPQWNDKIYSYEYNKWIWSGENWKIYDDGFYFIWDGKNMDGKIIAPGLYVYVYSDRSGLGMRKMKRGIRKITVVK